MRSSRTVCVSWRSLLLLLTACLHLGGAQDESLPPSLVDLVMNSPISSMQDLQNLLDVESVEEEEDEVHSNSTHKRLPRSLVGVQVAQQAMCKVRTEVMEVTRAMLDRRNANFLLWPLCVEVQRCSGCCNTRTLQCVPVATETRHLQMTKIQFINRQPVYEKVIIPVEDHLTCSCQSRAAVHAPRAKATPSPPPPPRLIPPKPALPKVQSKEELHRHDDLKQNQRLHLEDGQELQWASKYTLSHTQGVPTHTLTHTQGVSVHTLTHTQGYRPSPVQHTLTHTPAGPSHVSVDVSTRRTTLEVPHMLSDTTQHFTVQEGVKDPHRHQDGVKEGVSEHHTHPGSGDGRPSEHRHRHQHHQHRHLQHDEATPRQPPQEPAHDANPHSQVTLHHSGQLEAPILSSSHVEVIGQSSGQTELPDHHHSGVSGTSRFHHSQSEVANHRISQSNPRDGMEKDRNTEKPKQSQHDHHHHPTQATALHHSSTLRTVLSAPPTAPPPPQTPPPAPQRRRRRKHRRRMSKSAMRAMIMIMS